MTRRYEITTDIDAPPSRVWEILIDLNNWSKWSKINPGGSGTPKLGEVMQLKVLSSPKKTNTAQAKVTVCKPERELRWTGGLPIPGIYRIEHWYQIEPAKNNRCRVVHGEEHRGIMVERVVKPFGGQLEQYYKDTNEALKQLAEAAVVES